MELLYLFTPSRWIAKPESKSKGRFFQIGDVLLSLRKQQQVLRRTWLVTMPLEQYLKPQYPGNCGGVEAAAIVINSNHQLWTGPDYVPGG